MKQEVISSAKNPLIKRLLGFEKKRNRDYQKKFVVEGLRENRMALANAWVHEEIVLPESQSGNWLLRNDFNPENLRVQYISNELFEKVAYRGKVENMLGIYHAKGLSLVNLKIGDNPLVLILEALEKPGNIGAILRSADAAGVDAVILTDPVCDVYNPNIIRGSLGALFSLHVAICTNNEALEFIRQNNLRILTSYLDGSKPHFEATFTGGSCIVMGSESGGVSDFWTNNADEIIKIPMGGQIDSMNVSTAAAVLLFEAVRQRAMEKTKHKK